MLKTARKVIKNHNAFCSSLLKANFYSHHVPRWAKKKSASSLPERRRSRKRLRPRIKRPFLRRAMQNASRLSFVLWKHTTITYQPRCTVFFSREAHLCLARVGELNSEEKREKKKVVKRISTKGKRPFTQLFYYDNTVFHFSKKLYES